MTRNEYYQKYLNKPVFLRYILNGSGERTIVGILLQVDDGYGRLLVSSYGRLSHIDPSGVLEDYTPRGKVEA